MAKAVEGSLPSLLQGVSQQIQSERLGGQCTAQINMLSDPVTGIRRRVGSEFVGTTHTVSSTTQDNYQSFYIDEYGGGRHIVINTTSGNWEVHDNAWAVVSTGQSEYFKIPATSREHLQTTALAGKFYVLNPTVPVGVEIFNDAKLDPTTTGFFFIRTGAFNKSYIVTVGDTKAEYTTPDGTQEGDSGKSTPEYVCKMLVESLTASGITVSAEGAYAYLTTPAPCTVASPSGRNYCSTSNQSLVPTEADLPAICGGHYLCAVGTNINRLVWYQYNSTSKAWDESGAYNYSKKVTSLPMVLNFEDYTFKEMVVNPSESGDAKTNEDPNWMVEKIINGIGSYQGRLVFLSGAYASFSAVGKPDWWHRRTVTILDDTDRIDIASGSAANATLRQCFQFNKDLVLMGDAVQAVVPASTYLLSPENASIVVTGEYLCDSAVSPALCGPTVLYTNPRSTQYFAVSEMVPSQYTQSQYTSSDITSHIPRYLLGRCRKLVSSPTANMVLALCSTDANVVFVHEYFFAGMEKVQSAWHKWHFQHPVESVHFGNDRIWVLQSRVANGKKMLMVSSIDPRSDNLTKTNLTKPFSDTYVECSVTPDRKVVVPVHLCDPAAQTVDDGVVVQYPSGDMAGERITFEVVAGGVDTVTIQLERNFSGTNVLLGTLYKSLFAPTSPQVRDSNGNAITTSRTRLLRYELSLRQSGPFDARVVDEYSGVDYTSRYTPLLMNSPDLIPNVSMVAKVGRVPIPCRTNAGTTDVYLISEGVYDMNITGIEFIIQHPSKRGRI